ncbi:MAG: amidohydrolase [Alphaproteobacteria bacterium]|nr:amidohydrolase [Alphaproteobacteria bacterium]
MDGKVTIEEHFALPDTLGPGSSELHRRLQDFDGERIELMDKCGIAFAILSLNGPSVQAQTKTAEAIDMAQRANDLLAEEITKRPERLGGFAALPMQEPDAAIRELERAVGELGLLGANVNGFSETNGANSPLYYDQPEYRPFWATVDKLQVPFYLHPRNPFFDQIPSFEGHPWLTYASWAYALETAMHALRLICSGLFDDHPQLQMVLGHLGERIPFDLWRADNCLQRNPKGMPAKRTLRAYMQTNVHVSTSGQFHDPPLHLTIKEMGIKRVLFSIDYPYESMEQGSNWFDEAELSDEERLAIGRTNALSLFRLELK